MATPIKLRVDVDMRKIVTEAEKSADSVDDITDAFDSAGDASQDAAADSTRALEKVESASKDAAESVDKVSDSAGDAKGAVGDLGSAASSALEGDFAGAAQTAIGSVEDLTSSIPLVGGAAAAVAAIAGPAIGVIKGAFDDAKAASDEAKESAYQYALVVGGAGKYADVAARINDLTGSIEGLKKVQDIANVSGWEQVDVVKALSTGEGLPALWKAFEDGANTTNTSARRALELEGALQGAQEGFELGAHAAGLNATALYDLATAAGTATGEVDDLGNQIIRMPDGKTVVVDADTQQAFSDLDAIENRQLSSKTVTVNFQPDLAAWNQIRLPNKTVLVQAQMANNLSPSGRFGSSQD